MLYKSGFINQKKKFILFLSVLLLLNFFFINIVSADVCVWRDPERTMLRLFTQAEDYKTLVYKLTTEQIKSIEILLGEPLDDSEKHEFNIYAVNKDGQVLGWVMALVGVGEYGVIETVIGINTDHSIRGAYLQRVRERKRKALKSDEFLNQFSGKKQVDEFQINPVAGAEKASAEISQLIKKMLAFDAVLNRQQKLKP